MPLGWKMGFEVELMAPRGRSRRDLAERVAEWAGGRVTTVLVPESEPSKVPGRPIFHNLAQGFVVDDAQGRPIASFVDDPTLQADCDRTAPARPGWFRIVADDARLLRLVARHCEADAPTEQLLAPFAALFGTAPIPAGSGMVRVADEAGASLAICVPLPGERERPCEIVTAPIVRDHAEMLRSLLGHARALDFTVPLEGAAHVHFDAAPLCSARVLARLIALFDRFGTALKALVAVNPHCVRLGEWPRALVALVTDPAFEALDWAAARAALAELPLVKYCDFNLVNMVRADPAKHSFEVRILPATLDPDAIIRAAGLFEAMLGWCAGSAPLVSEWMAFLERLPMEAALRDHWLDRARRQAPNLFPKEIRS